MKIDKKFLDEQIATFSKQRVELMATVQATEGALQLCEHLLKVLDMKQPPKEEVPDLKDLLPEGAEIVEPEGSDEKR